MLSNVVDDWTLKTSEVIELLTEIAPIVLPFTPVIAIKADAGVESSLVIPLRYKKSSKTTPLTPLGLNVATKSSSNCSCSNIDSETIPNTRPRTPLSSVDNSSPFKILAKTSSAFNLSLFLIVEIPSISKPFSVNLAIKISL